MDSTTRKKYPKNWKKLSYACREKANWECERCGIKHKTMRKTFSGKLYPVYLVAAHEFHDPWNPNPFLVCLCPSCHWKYFRRPGQRAPWMIERRKHRVLLQVRGYRS